MCTALPIYIFLHKTDRGSKHLLINVLDFSNTYGQRFLSISSFDIVHLLDGVAVLGQAGQAVDGVCGHGHHQTVFQCFHAGGQDFSAI